MRKSLLLIFITLGTIALTGALVHYMKMPSLAFAWALNFLLMFCVVFFTEALKSPFTSAYFNAKLWEQKGKIYESLGIHFYRKLLVWIGWEKLNKKSNPIEKNTLAHVHLQTKKSEFSHLIILIVVFGFNVYVAIQYGVLNSIWLLLLNVLFNLYPVFLQRYTRPRVERVLNLKK